MFWRCLKSKNLERLYRKPCTISLLMSERIKKVNELMLRETALLVQQMVDVPGGLITLTRADTAPNLYSCKLYYAVYPEEKAEEAKEALEKQIGRIQYALNRKLHMKYVPNIEFIEEPQNELGDPQ